MAKEKISRLDEISILRGMGIIAVVLIHLTSNYGNYDSNSLIYVIYGVLNKILNFAVPLFIFISGAVLMYQAKEQGGIKWGKFYYKRLVKTLTPYFIWVAIYFIYFYQSGREMMQFYKNEWNYIFNYIIIGKLCYHLYFIPLIIQFYLIFPFLWEILSRIKRTIYFKDEKARKVHNVVMFTLVTMILILIQYLLLEFHAYCIYPYFKNPATLLLSYVMPLGMGLWFGYRWYDCKSIRKFIRIIIYPTAVITGYIFIKSSINELDINVTNRALGLIRNIFTTMISIVLLELAIHFNRVKGKFSKLLADLGNHSFSIYLSHPLIIYILINELDVFYFISLKNEFWDYTVTLLCKFGIVLLFSYFLALSIANFNKVWLNLCRKKSKNTSTEKFKIKGNYTNEEIGNTI